MAKANHLKTKETDAVVVTPQSTATVVQTSSGGGAPTTSNFILVRAARSDSGQLILQNGHELLSLLNEASENGGIIGGTSVVNAGSGSSGTTASILGDGKPIVLQTTTTTHHQRIKTRSLSTESTNITAVQPIIKSTTLEGTSTATATGGTFFLQSGSLKKGTLAADGSIILQQRLTKAGTGDNAGPILLQTLKRLDKTPSILVIRNAASTTTIPATSTATVVTGMTTTKLPQRPQQMQTVQTVTQVRTISEDRKLERVVEKTTRHVSNIPLGSGKYQHCFPYFYRTFPYIWFIVPHFSLVKVIIAQHYYSRLMWKMIVVRS